MDPQTKTIMFIKCAIGVMIASVILSSHPHGVRYATMFKVVVVKTMPPPNTKNVGAPLYRQSSSELYCKPTFGHEIRSKWKLFFQRHSFFIYVNTYHHCNANWQSNNVWQNCLFMSIIPCFTSFFIIFERILHVLFYLPVLYVPEVSIFAPAKAESMNTCWTVLSALCSHFLTVFILKVRYTILKVIILRNF